MPNEGRLYHSPWGYYLKPANPALGRLDDERAHLPASPDDIRYYETVKGYVFLEGAPRTVGAPVGRADRLDTPELDREFKKAARTVERVDPAEAERRRDELLGGVPFAPVQEGIPEPRDPNARPVSDREAVGAGGLPMPEIVTMPAEGTGVDGRPDTDKAMDPRRPEHLHDARLVREDEGHHGVRTTADQGEPKVRMTRDERPRATDEPSKAQAAKAETGKKDKA